MRTKNKVISFILITIAFVLMALSVPYSTITSIDNDIVLSQEEFDNLISNNPSLMQNNCVTCINDNNTEEINKYVIKS